MLWNSVNLSAKQTMDWKLLFSKVFRYEIKRICQKIKPAQTKKSQFSIEPFNCLLLFLITFCSFYVGYSLKECTRIKLRSFIIRSIFNLWLQTIVDHNTVNFSKKIRFKQLHLQIILKSTFKRRFSYGNLVTNYPQNHENTQWFRTSFLFHIKSKA